MSKTIKGIAQQLKDANKKVQLIYAFNGTGKTRLSLAFKKLIAEEIDTPEVGNAGTSELSRKNIIYYNAFTEDLFYWDNDLNGDKDRKLKIHPNAFTKWVLEEQGKGPTIIDHFQRLTNSNIEPIFSSDFSEISFMIRGSHSDNVIKISKGEESNLIWSMFYSFIEMVIEELSSSEDDRSTNDFDKLKYVFIDDPVSSLDDNHLIELAVDLAKIIKKSPYIEGSGLRYIITTHNPLFYNVLHNELNSDLKNSKKDESPMWLYKRAQSEKYKLDKKADGTFELSASNDHPFSYHLFLLAEITQAIKAGQIKKYHFSFLRNILEKTATFLGYPRWEDLLEKTAEDTPNPFASRLMNLSSHSAHAGEEIANIEDRDKEKLEDLVNYLTQTYGFRKQETQ